MQQYQYLQWVTNFAVTVPKIPSGAAPMAIQGVALVVLLDFHSAPQFAEHRTPGSTGTVQILQGITASWRNVYSMFTSEAISGKYEL